MAPSPFLPLALSFHPSLFCLVPPRTSPTVLIFLHHPPLSKLSSSTAAPALLHPLSSVPRLPLLSLPLYPQLISSSFLVFRPFQFHFSNLACSHIHARACLLSLTFPPLFPPSLSLITISSRTRPPSPSGGHVDLSRPFWAVTPRLFTGLGGPEGPVSPRHSAALTAQSPSAPRRQRQQQLRNQQVCGRTTGSYYSLLRRRSGSCPRAKEPPAERP